jgi:hypothetical protein
MKKEKKDNIYSSVSIPVPLLDLVILAGICALILIVVAAT